MGELLLSFLEEQSKIIDGVSFCTTGVCHETLVVKMPTKTLELTPTLKELAHFHSLQGEDDGFAWRSLEYLQTLIPDWEEWKTELKLYPLTKEVKALSTILGAWSAVATGDIPTLEGGTGVKK